MTVFERNDNPEKNKIFVVKKHERKIRHDAYGNYVLLHNMRAYVDSRNYIYRYEVK